MDQSRKSKVPISIAIVVLTLLLSIGLLLTTAGSPAAVAADTTSTVVSTQLNYGGLNNPDAIAFDSAGNMYILNSGAQNSGGTASITVVAKHSGIIFGQYIRANTPTVLKAAKGLYNPVGIVFDSAGNMYIANGVSDPTGEGSITVVAKHSGIIFGQYIRANTPTMLNAATGLDNPSGIAFNSGDMYVANGVLDQTGKGNITVMAKHSGIIFGQYIQANKATMLDAARGFNNPANIAFNSGDMYITSEVFAPNYRGNITVIAKRSGRIFGQYIQASKATVLDAATELVHPDAIAFDSAGNMYVANEYELSVMAPGDITIIAKRSGTIFGQYIRANTPTMLDATTGLAHPDAIAFDSAGNMYIAEGYSSISTSDGFITVIAKRSGRIFGQYIRANTPTMLDAATGLDNPTGIAFNSGDMYIVNDYGPPSKNLGYITVIAKRSGTIFGQYIQANKATVLDAAKGLDYPTGIAFNSGNIYITNVYGSSKNLGYITVIAKRSGRIFGQYIQANKATVLDAAKGLDYPTGIAFNSGNMYIVNDSVSYTKKLGFVTVIAKRSGAIFGQYIRANKATVLDAAKKVLFLGGIAFNSGDMYIANSSSYALAPSGIDYITVIAKRSGAIFGQYIRANKATVLDVTKKVVFPIGIAFDSVGNMYMTSFNNSNASGVGFVTVIAKHSGAIFGQYIRANKATVLKTINPALASPFPLTTTFDSAGNMYIGSPTSNSIYVVGNHRLDFSKSTLPSATLNTHYSAHLSASGGIFGYDWYLSRGKLPNGLHLNSLTGQITGTPNKTGTSSFSVTVLDLAGEYKTENLSISVAAHQ